MNKNEIYKQLLKILGIVDKNNINDIKDQITKLFTIEIDGSVKAYLEDKYIKQHNSIKRQEQIKEPMSPEEYVFMQNYLQGIDLWESYAYITDSLSKKINSILRSNFDGYKFNYTEAKKQILKEIPSFTRYRTDRIIRTETANIRRVATERTYREIDPNGELKYRWLSIPDKRRTSICATISRRSARGVSLDELKEIVKEEADPRTYREDREWLPHINCRSMVQRI